MRDGELIAEIIKTINVFIICFSLDQEFSEDSIKNVYIISLFQWINIIQSSSFKKNIYLVGCKLDLKVMKDYQTGQSTEINLSQKASNDKETLKVSY